MHRPARRSARRRAGNLLRRLVSFETLESRTLLAGDFGFAQRIGASGSDKPQAVTLDSAGNVYLTGEFSGTVDFDPGAGISNRTATGGDAFVAKYSSTGALIWVHSFGSSGFDGGRDIAVDAGGNAYVVANFSGNMTVGTTALTPAGAGDAVLVKYDSAGNVLFAGNFGGTNGETVRSVGVDSFGDVYLAGQYNGTADLDPTSGVQELTSEGDFDAFVVKVSSAGIFQWARSFGGLSNFNNGDIVNALAVDSNANVLLTGEFRDTADFDPGTGVFNMSTGPTAGHAGMFVSKLDTNGDFVWARQFTSTADASASGIAVDAQGSVITTGAFQTTVDFDPSAGTFNLTAAPGFFSAFVTKLEADGDFVWASKMGGPGGAEAFGIALDPARGDVFTTGQFSGTGDFDPGAGTANRSALGTSIDVYVSHLDSNGQFVSAYAAGATNVLDRGRAIAFNNVTGHVFASAEFQGTADFDPTAGTANLTSAGSSDVALFQLNAGPVITSAPLSASVPENATQVVGTVTAVHPLDAALTFRVAGGPDGARFSVDPVTGVVSFSDGNFETKTTYIGEVAASDGDYEVKQAITVTVTDVNDPPTAQFDGPTVRSLPEDSDTSVRIPLASFRIIDDALGDEVFTPAGVDAALLEVEGTTVYLKAGTVLNFNAQPSISVRVFLDDPEVGSNPDATLSYTLDITEVVANVKPRLNLSSTPYLFIENDAPARLVPGATVTDADSPNFAGGTLTLTITAGLDSAADRLGIASTGTGAAQIQVDDSDVHYEGELIGSINATNNGLGGNPLVVMLNASATAPAVQALVRHITFQTVGDNPSTTQRSVQFVVTDGDGGTSIPKTKPVDVRAVNDRPSMPFGGGRNYRENGAAVQVVANAPVSDVDDPHFNGGFLRVSLSSGGETTDVLNLRTAGGITTSGDVVSFNGLPIGTFTGGSNLQHLVISFDSDDATAAAVRAVVQAVGFRSTSENPTAGPHVVRFVLNDGQANSVARTRTINVIPINDRPLILDLGTTLGYTRGAPPIQIATAATVVEDQPNFSGGKLRITNLSPQTSDQLLIRGSFNVEVGTNKVFLGSVASGVHIGDLNAGGGVGSTALEVTLNANASPAVAQQLIRGIRFRTGASAVAGPRTFYFQLTDTLGLAGNTAVVRVVTS